MLANNESIAREGAVQAASYKSIALHWTDTPDAKHRLDVAVELASRFDAHLTILCLGVMPDAPAMVYGGFAADVVAQNIGDVQADAEAIEAAAKKELDRAGVLGDTRIVVASLGGLANAIGRSTRYADLVIVGQPYGGDDEAVLVSVLEGALFDGGAGVLVCPREGATTIGEKALIGWNASRQALNAVRHALPLLQRAASAEILLVDPESRLADEGPDPGAEISVMLARQGVKVTDTVTASLGRPVSDVIRNRIDETGADLLVMGAYGHSRFREFVLGGVTLGMLKMMPIPMLMAH